MNSQSDHEYTEEELETRLNDSQRVPLWCNECEKYHVSIVSFDEIRKTVLHFDPDGDGFTGSEIIDAGTSDPFGHWLETRWREFYEDIWYGDVLESEIPADLRFFLPPEEEEWTCHYLKVTMNDGPPFYMITRIQRGGPTGPTVHLTNVPPEVLEYFGFDDGPMGIQGISEESARAAGITQPEAAVTHLVAVRRETAREAAKRHLDALARAGDNGLRVQRGEHGVELGGYEDELALILQYAHDDPDAIAALVEDDSPEEREDRARAIEDAARILLGLLDRTHLIEQSNIY